MKPYRSHSGKPFGATGYEAGSNYIIVQFQNGARYKYTYASCGRAAVAHMKQLAQQQRGLSTYVAQHAPGYEEKWDG
jgi:hypothetical protein